jgi:hypothetical protein
LAFTAAPIPKDVFKFLKFSTTNMDLLAHRNTINCWNNFLKETLLLMSAIIILYSYFLSDDKYIVPFCLLNLPRRLAHIIEWNEVNHF